MLKTVVLSSLEKVKPEGNFGAEVKKFTALKNDPLSFQIAFKLENTDAKSDPVHIRIESELDVSLYYVGYVPVIHTDNVGFDNPPPVGIYPDMLHKRQINPKIVDEGYPWASSTFEVGEDKRINAYNDAWQSIWLIVNENGKNMPTGKHNVTVKFLTNCGKTVAAKCVVSVEIIDAKLPQQKLYCTNWFHCDCLADAYGVEVFSEEFFVLLKNYAACAAKNGQNMILLPAFTPPLDTPIGTERKTVQLVKIAAENDEYTFDFSLMKRFIDVCLSAGIKYFEHSHLFTQWGAVAAPKICAMVNGKYKKIFGWETKASGKKYKKFLEQYIPAMLKFLKGEKLDKRTLFHIADEPTESNRVTYTAAVNTVGSLLDGYMVGDALSDVVFYEQGIVKTPIAKTRDAIDFVGKCDNLWIYYTGEEIKGGMSNRLIPIPSERNRMIGVQMYYFDIKGFLHWAYNYYYGVLSHGKFDPKYEVNTFAGGGTSYLVYTGANGEPIQSMRQKVFYEGINDMRALETLEKLTSREYCMKLINDTFGEMNFYKAPKTAEQLLQFRERVNKEIKKRV